LKLSVTDDDCCTHGICKHDSNKAMTKEVSTKNEKSVFEFFRHVKTMYAAALGFNHIGIPFAYAMGYYLQLSLRL
jgi:hypothetical protein